MDGLESCYGRLSLDGAHRAFTEAATLRSRYQSEITPGPDGRLAAVLDRFDHPWEIGTRSMDGGEWTTITSLNDRVAKQVPPRRMRRLAWESTDGFRIEGLVAEPSDGAEPRGLVINARGGPSWPLRWGTIPLQASVAVNAGYAVLMANPRGTPGRGSAFNTAIIGQPGFGELDDTFAGVDACVKAGIARPGPVAIMGGSWAGYLTALAVAVRSERLACAIMMFGLSNLVSFHRTSYEPRFTEYLLQQQPHGADGIATYMRFSPVTYLAGPVAPTLILHGELDDCTPLGQGVEFYHALEETGSPVELVVYPREGHSASNWKRGHQMDLARRVADWLGRYLDPIQRG